LTGQAGGGNAGIRLSGLNFLLLPGRHLRVSLRSFGFGLGLQF